MAIDLVSFDLDGTLVDTAGEITEAANRTLAAFGMAPRSFEQVRALIGAGTRELMRRLLVQAVLPQSPNSATLSLDQVMERFDSCYVAIAGRSVQPYPGCHESLRRLKAAGVRLACVTNKEMRHARAAHLGDSVTDVQAARNAGIAAWAVPYDYNAGQPITDAAPDRIFDTLPWSLGQRNQNGRAFRMRWAVVMVTA